MGRWAPVRDLDGALDDLLDGDGVGLFHNTVILHLHNLLDRIQAEG